MKIFVFEFDSMWLGGTAVVIAENETEAHKLLTEEHGETLIVNSCVEKELKRSVVYYYNGDY